MGISGNYSAPVKASTRRQHESKTRAKLARQLEKKARDAAKHAAASKNHAKGNDVNEH